jgi:hypothetical protein
VNYMKPLGPDDGPDIHWRYHVALKAAERLGRPCTCPHPFMTHIPEDGSDC